MNAAKAPVQKKAYSDSLVKYNNISQALPVKVTFSEFTRGESRAVLGINVEAVKPTTTTSGGARRTAAAGGAP